MVTTCLADLEFTVTRGALLASGVHLNTCGPGDHMPVIERRIRTIKEMVRGLLMSLPFARIPDVMVVQSVVFSVMWLNFFCPKGGVSNHISPHTIITGMIPDATKHCRIPFGGYAQVHVEPTRSNDVMIARTVGAISLGPTGNIQGTYKFLSLLTRRLIQARSFTPLPMPQDVITVVNEMAPEGRGMWHLNGVLTSRKSRLTMSYIN